MYRYLNKSHFVCITMFHCLAALYKRAYLSKSGYTSVSCWRCWNPLPGSSTSPYLPPGAEGRKPSLPVSTGSCTSEMWVNSNTSIPVLFISNTVIISTTKGWQVKHCHCKQKTLVDSNITNFLEVNCVLQLQAWVLFEIPSKPISK